MSGIAEVLLNLGFIVTGSDRELSPVTKNLKRLGATIQKGHRAKMVHESDVVVISSAIPPDNPEVEEANRLKIPVIRRAEMLGELMRMKQGVAIAGTHGKTTTTSMAGLVLQEGGFDPTLIVGGKIRSLKTNAKLGEGDYMVVEADEFDRSFLQLTPMISVITNIETEHLDCYRDLDEIKETFAKFANKTPFYGAIILCLDEVSLQEIIPKLHRRIVTYGVTPQAEIRAVDMVFKAMKTEFTVFLKNNNLGKITIQLPGEYNVKNALAALAVGLELEIPFSKIKKALEEFNGVHRRFEIKDNISGVLIVDDYAHHPTEIKASLHAARSGWDRRIIAVFQPHLYTRTRDFYRDFGQSFFNADMLIVTDIYPAREAPIPGVTGKMVSDCARSLGHPLVEFIPDPDQVLQYLIDHVRENDLVITLGAGNVYQIGEKLIQLLKTS